MHRGIGRFESILPRQKRHGGLVRLFKIAAAVILSASLLFSDPAQAGWKSKLIGSAVVVDGIELMALRQAALSAARDVGQTSYEEALETLRVKIEKHPIAGLRSAESELESFASQSPNNIKPVERVLTDLGVDPDKVLGDEAATNIQTIYTSSEPVEDVFPQLKGVNPSGGTKNCVDCANAIYARLTGDNRKSDGR